MYTAPITGQYRFDFNGNDVNSNYRFYIYADNNETKASNYYQDKGKTVELKEGETYAIIVKQFSGYLDYTINIGVPNAIVNIESNSFSGNLAYTGQLDRYTYTAPTTGKYRFDFVSDNVQNDYRFYAYAADNTLLASEYYTRGGKTIDLIAGETYRIEIKQSSGIEKYTINIGIPNIISNIEGNSITGNLTYKDQEDRYTYTAPTTGNYTFNFETNDASTDYRFYIFSSNNAQIVSKYYSNKKASVQLEAGQVYTIKIRYSSGFPLYQIGIDVP